MEKQFYHVDKRWYLIALAGHERIFDRGCAQIWHHQCESYYRALVTGSAEVFLDLIKQQLCFVYVVLS